MMKNESSAHRYVGLEAVAELLLWAGWDRAADNIYATIYGEDAAECQMPPLHSGHAAGA